ncbi:hypothetical protein QQG55_17220 [Brugia pahangi]
MATMGSYSTLQSSDFCWKSSAKDALSSEHLDEGARPVYSKQFVLTNDIQHFIPEYIREKFHEPIEPNLCTIKVTCKAEKKEQLFYTFQLNWYKDKTHIDTDSSNMVISKSEKSPINVIQRNELKQERPLQSLETNVEIAPTTTSTGEEIRSCDGPCGKMRSVKELWVHGRCEHAICRFCTINAPMVKNIDGTPGCCNRECFATDLAALCPDPIQRHKYFQNIINKRKIDEIIATGHRNNSNNTKRLQEAMNLSSATQTSPVNKRMGAKRDLKELISVKVLILEKGPIGTISRRCSINEIGSTESLRSTLQWIAGYGQNLHKCRIFVNYGESDDNSKLKEINLKQYGDKKISSFPSVNGMFSFVIDYINLIGRSSTSSYI